MFHQHRQCVSFSIGVQRKLSHIFCRTRWHHQHLYSLSWRWGTWRREAVALKCFLIILFNFIMYIECRSVCVCSIKSRVSTYWHLPKCRLFPFYYRFFPSPPTCYMSKNTAPAPGRTAFCYRIVFVFLRLISFFSFFNKHQTYSVMILVPCRIPNVVDSEARVWEHWRRSNCTSNFLLLRHKTRPQPDVTHNVRLCRAVGG